MKRQDVELFASLAAFTAGLGVSAAVLWAAPFEIDSMIQAYIGALAPVLIAAAQAIGKGKPDFARFLNDRLWAGALTLFVVSAAWPWLAAIFCTLPLPDSGHWILAGVIGTAGIGWLMVLSRR